jgi:NADPH:quinone reductase-like Zn-dependent oxidoreductase
MKAIVHHRYGTPDVLELTDIDKPDIADDEVLVRVHAAGVDRGVWHLMAGLPYPIRLAGYGVRAPKNPVPGMDFAGVVEAVGKDVTRFQPGDEVFGIGKGTYAEYAAAAEDKLAPKPANLTFEQAAVVAISGSTALHALRDHGQLQPGQTVLIIGASGGVGTYAVQLAKALGAHVTGVCSTTKVDLVRSIGADHVIDYTRGDFADGRHHYDLILDIGGNSPLSRLLRALTPDGTAIIVGGETGGRCSAATTGRFERSPCRPSSARSSAPSSTRRTTRTWSPSPSSSTPERSPRSSNGPTPCTTPPRPSATWRKATPAASSSSASASPPRQTADDQARPATGMTGIPAGRPN